jgi:hypothetical protein
MIIRKEENRDLEAITQVTIAAFKNHPISRQDVSLVLPFNQKIPKGIVIFHEAFKAES